MSLKLLYALTCISVVFSHPVFAFTAANDNVKLGDATPNTPTSGAASQVEIPVTPAQDGSGGQAVTAPADECNRRSENSAKTCSTYLNPPQRREASQSNELPGSATRTIGQINRSIEGGVMLFQARFRSCIFSTEVCVQSCGSKPEQINKCNGLRTAAEKRNEEIQRQARDERGRNDNLQESLTGRNPQERTGSPAVPPLPIVSGGIRENSPPPALTANKFQTQSTAPMAAAAQAVKTPEQAKQERREKRREESRQERIDALGKAFMNLNPQQPLGQALQERSYGQSEQRTQTAAAKAAAAEGPSAAEAPEQDEEEIGRAGFNKLAEKNLAARKKLAAAMGVNASNLSASALTRPQAATGGGGGFGGSVFGGTNSFSHSADGASLDPEVNIEPPSDLPQNFRLEAPSAGGGGGGGGSGSSRRMFGSMFSNDRDPNFSPRARGPAGLEDTEQPQEIRRRNADIWNVISVSFRRHCALGRLMDCADHLPK